MTQSGRRFLGTLAHLPCKDTLEILGYAGFDFVIVDMEHSPIDAASSVDYIRAAEAAGILPLVRVPDVQDTTAIRKVLDNGAAGVVVPGISNAKQAQAAVAFAKFPPQGLRGACPMVRANRYYTFGPDNHYIRSNQLTAVVLLVEGKEGIENFDAILEVPGIDAIFFGPVDMAISLGYNGDVNHPQVVEEIRGLIEMANAKSVCVGTCAATADDVGKWVQAGAAFVLVSCDIMMYAQQVNEVVRRSKEQL